MKNWNTIGQFSKKVGVTAKALRLYEKMKLLQSHTRGDNGYRYYHDDQIERALRLTDFKKLGFTLVEIKSLFDVDEKLSPQDLVQSMQQRLYLISTQVQKLNTQQKQIQKILNSLNKKTKPLGNEQRRAIMSFYGKVFIAITGVGDLSKTAKSIQSHFKKVNQHIPIYDYNEQLRLPEEKPYIVLIPEKELVNKSIQKLQPDVIVVTGLGEHSTENQKNYLNLFSHVGPHVNTIINADDRAAVDLADQALIKKGRIFYFSKNKALVPQIKKIGGVVSDGEEVSIYGFNLNSEVINLKFQKIMPFSDEIALLSSIAAILTIGFTKNDLSLSP